MLTISSDELNSPRTNALSNSKCICTSNSCLKTCCLCLNACKDNVDNVIILTLHCCGIKTNCDDDSIHGIAYIPLDNSKYASIDALSEIENEFQNFQKNSKYLFLHGDFNSRISKEPDVINFESESGNDENVEHLFIDTSDA